MKDTIDICITITRNLGPYISIVNSCYSNYKKKPTLECIEFEDRVVALKIPMEGVELDNGWKIEPLKETTISQEQVDLFRTNQEIPCFELKAISRGNKWRTFDFTFTLHGIKENHSGNKLKMITSNSYPREDEPETLAIQELKARTRVTDAQLDCQILEKDFLKLSIHFDNVETYLVHLGLNPSQQRDIKDLAVTRGTQIAMSEALRRWREPNPYTATYRMLVKILLDLGKGEVAVRVCNYLSLKGDSF